MHQHGNSVNKQHIMRTTWNIIKFALNADISGLSFLQSAGWSWPGTIVQSCWSWPGTIVRHSPAGHDLVQLSSHSPAGHGLVQLSSHSPAGHGLVQLSSHSPAGHGLVQLSSHSPAGHDLVQLSSHSPAGHGLVQLSSHSLAGHGLVQLSIIVLLAMVWYNCPVIVWYNCPVMLVTHSHHQLTGRSFCSCSSRLATADHISSLDDFCDSWFSIEFAW